MRQTRKELPTEEVFEKDMFEQNFLVGWLARKRMNIIRLLSHLDGPHNKILAIGCGYGHHLTQFSGKKYGLDISENYVKKAAENVSDGFFVIGDGNYFPFKDDMFNCVIISEVLEHVTDPKKIVEEAKRVTKSGGEIIITIPNETNIALSRAVMLRRPAHPLMHLWDIQPKDLDELFGLKKQGIRNIPFNLPFSVSIHHICIYENKK